MNLERAIRRASSVPGHKSAARLYNDIEFELALGEPSDRLEDACERALALLENRFPGVRDAAREIEDPPSLSRRASDALHSITQTRPRPPAHRRPHPRRVSRSSRRLYAHGRAHPLLALAMVTFAIFVIVHYLIYIVLGAIALSALKARGART
jgi:hypothetical protein